MNHHFDWVGFHPIDFDGKVVDRGPDVVVGDLVLEVTDLSFVYPEFLHEPVDLFSPRSVARKTELLRCDVRYHKGKAGFRATGRTHRPGVRNGGVVAVVVVLLDGDAVDSLDRGPGTRIRGENFVAAIETGRVGPEQAKPVKEF